MLGTVDSTARACVAHRTAGSSAGGVGWGKTAGFHRLSAASRWPRAPCSSQSPSTRCTRPKHAMHTTEESKTRAKLSLCATKQWYDVGHTASAKADVKSASAPGACSLLHTPHMHDPTRYSDQYLPASRATSWPRPRKPPSLAHWAPAASACTREAWDYTQVYLPLAPASSP